jgi:hypothetical protein
LFVRFLEESEDTKKSFRSYLTFSAWSFGLSDPDPSNMSNLEISP